MEDYIVYQRPTDASNNEIYNQSESLSGFALQVGSFRMFERANLLKNDLSKKGYRVFIAAAEISEKDGIWHRVVIGRFLEKEVAVKTAIILKETENLKSIIKKNII